MDKPIEQVNTRPAPITTQLNETLALSIQKQLNRGERGKAVDIRPASSALLTINSADRYKPYNNRFNTPDLSGVLLTSPYDFTIPLPGNIMSGFFTRIALTSLQLPFTVPTICGKTNGIYIWWQPGGSGAVTRYLAQVSLNTFGGYNSVANILTALQPRIRTLTGSTTFTCAPNGTNGALYNSNNTDKFYFTRWDNPAVPGAATFFDLLNIQDTQILSVTQFSYPVPILTQYLDIVCDQLTIAQNLKDASTGGSGKTLLKRIYLFGDNTTTLFTAATTFFSGPNVIQKSYAVPKYISWNSDQNIGALRIQVLDDRGIVLTCGPNNGPFSPSATNEAGHMWLDENMSDWSMEIMLSEI